MTLIAVHTPQDIVRLNTGTVDGTYRGIAADIENRRQIYFNYNSSKEAVTKGLGGNITLAQALALVSSKGSKDSRRYNTDVINTIWPKVADIQGLTIKSPQRFVGIGSGLATKFQPLCYLARDKKLEIIIDQFRKHKTAPSDEAIRLIASAFIDQFSQDEFVNAAALIFDAKARNGDKQRSVVLHRIPAADPQDVVLFNEIATIYSKAFLQYASEIGAEIKKSSLAQNIPQMAAQQLF